jgi:hypothetical protein
MHRLGEAALRQCFDRLSAVIQTTSIAIDV